MSVDILLLSDDLLFASKITGVARALGISASVVRQLGGLLERIVTVRPACVILDLQHPGLDVATVVQAALPMRVLAYGSHVDAASLHAARAAGCDPVFPRSTFVERLETDLANWVIRPS